MQVLLEEGIHWDGCLADVVRIHTRGLSVSRSVGVPQDGQAQGRSRVGVTSVTQLQRRGTDPVVARRLVGFQL